MKNPDDELRFAVKLNRLQLCNDACQLIATASMLLRDAADKMYHANRDASKALREFAQIVAKMYVNCNTLNGQVKQNLMRMYRERGTRGKE